MDEENKQCPFCGSKNTRAVEYKNNYKPLWYEYMAVCMNCGYHGFIPYETWKKWNKRSDKDE